LTTAAWNPVAVEDLFISLLEFAFAIRQLSQLVRFVRDFDRFIKNAKRAADCARNRALADLTAGKVGCDRGPELVAITWAQPRRGSGDQQELVFRNWDWSCVPHSVASLLRPLCDWQLAPCRPVPAGAFLSKIEQILHDADDRALRHQGAGGAGQQSLISRPILDRSNTRPKRAAKGGGAELPELNVCSCDWRGSRYEIGRRAGDGIHGTLTAIRRIGRQKGGRGGRFQKIPVTLIHGRAQRSILDLFFAGSLGMSALHLKNGKRALAMPETCQRRVGKSI
jgi:hypothetical protein